MKTILFFACYVFIYNKRHITIIIMLKMQEVPETYCYIVPENT